MKFNGLIPELTVRNIEDTKRFYIDLLGFKLEYERPLEKFIFLSYGESQMMFEEYHEEGWNIGKLEYPLGQGINFSIESSNIEEVYQRVLDESMELYREIKVSRYRSGEVEMEQMEFLIQDPDGYLLRFTKKCCNI